MTPLFSPIYATGGLREKCLSFAQDPQLTSNEARSEVRAAKPGKAFGWEAEAFKRRNARARGTSWQTSQSSIFVFQLPPEALESCVWLFSYFPSEVVP